MLITGAVESINAEKSRAVGVDDYCVKTSDYKELIDVVNDMVIQGN